MLHVLYRHDKQHIHPPRDIPHRLSVHLHVRKPLNVRKQRVTKEIQNQGQDEDYADEDDSGNRVSSKSSDGTQSEEEEEKNLSQTLYT